MAVGSFLKSSGIAALAIGLAAMALPASASAQESNWSRAARANDAAQQQRGGALTNMMERSRANREAPRVNREARNNARNWQQRGNGEVRGNGGNWQNRGDGGARRGTWTPGRPQAQQPVQAAPTQVQRRTRDADRPMWRGGDRQQDTRSQWESRRDRDGRWDRNRDGDRRWDRNRDRVRNDGDRWRGDRNRQTYRGDYRRWDNNWRRDNRYNWYNYRNANRHIYRLGRYYSPYNNWSYRRLNIGFFLQPLFYSSNYWINDPWYYRLPEVYGPYRWVRYYDDALLVDVYTGQVVDVIYDFFW